MGMDGGYINGRMSPTQRRLVQVLGDGMPHTKKELLACLNDNQAQLATVDMHICNLRKALIEKHLDIIFRNGGYRLVRYISSSE